MITKFLRHKNRHGQWRNNRVQEHYIMANNTEKDTRSKTWNLIVYPESAPEGWKELLVEDGISFVCSPLHDKDILPTGEIKRLIGIFFCVLVPIRRLNKC